MTSEAPAKISSDLRILEFLERGSSETKFFSELPLFDGMGNPHHG